MSTTVLGKVSITPKGAWSASTSYEPLDVVSYGGSAFLARRANSNVTPTEGADWQMIAEKATVGNIAQTTGDSETDVMSQKAATDSFAHLSSELQDAHIMKSLPNGVSDEISDDAIIKKVGTLKLSSSLMWIEQSGGSGFKNYAFLLKDAIPYCRTGAMKLSDDRFVNASTFTAPYQYQILGDGNLYLTIADTDDTTIFDGLGVEFIYQLANQQIVNLPSSMTPNTTELTRLMEKVYSLKNFELQDVHVTRTLPNSVADEIIDGKMVKRVGCVVVSSNLVWTYHSDDGGFKWYTIPIDNAIPNCIRNAAVLSDSRFVFSNPITDAHQYNIGSDGTISISVSLEEDTTIFDGLGVEFIYQLNESQVLTISHDVTPNTKELVRVSESVGELSRTVDRIANDFWLKKPQAYNSVTLKHHSLIPLCVDNGVCYGNTRGYLVALSSTTDFENFVSGHAFSMGIQKIVVSKTHIIVSVWDMGNTAGEIWVCPKEQGVNGEFTKVFTFPAGVGVPRHGGLNAYYDDLRNIVVMSSYGKFGESRFGYLSVDGGVTFKQIFEAEGDTSHYHIHDIAYDQYQDRIWIASGDYISDKIYFSDDRGATWTVAHGTGYQSTTIVPMPDYVLFGSDYVPLGVYKWDREIERQQKALKEYGDISKAMSVAIVLDSTLTAAECYSYGFYKESDNIAYIVFCGVGGTPRKSFIVATGDGGRSFHVILANSEENYCGAQVIAGEVNGSLIVEYWNADGMGTLMMDKIIWE